MPQLVKYVRETGAIVGLFESEQPEVLDYQRLLDPAAAYLLLEHAILPTEQLQYDVCEGQVCRKALLVIQAEPSSFPAEGDAVSLLTVAPFVPCTLRVDGTHYALTDEDAILALTAEVPHLFQIELAPMPGYWASPILVRAT